MPMYVKNYGLSSKYTNNNGKTMIHETKWVGKYDGNVANVDIDMNDNGSKEHVRVQLDNDDLFQLLNRKAIDEPIEERLQRDFVLSRLNTHPYKLRNPRLRKNTKRRAVKKNSKVSNKGKNKTRKMKSLIQISSL